MRLWHQRYKERQADLIKLNKALEFNRCSEMLFLKMILTQMKHTLKKEKKLLNKYLEQKT